MTQMRVTSTAETITTVALVDGSLRGTLVSQLTERLCELLTGGRTVVVDVTGLHGLSTDVVSALLGARREATLRGSRLLLRASDARSQALLRRSALDRVFTVVRDGNPRLMWRHP
jgi:anti-anti-sigma regulatory factor